MATKVNLLIFFLGLSFFRAVAYDSLHIAFVKQKGATVLVKVECIDVDFYSIEEDQVRVGLFNLSEDCYLDLKTVSYHIKQGDSIPALVAYPHWFGYKKGKFNKTLTKRKLLQLPIGYTFSLRRGRYTLYLAYYSRRYGRCLRSNVIEFEVY